MTTLTIRYDDACVYEVGPAGAAGARLGTDGAGGRVARNRPQARVEE